MGKAGPEKGPRLPPNTRLISLAGSPKLATANLVPGRSVYGEQLVAIEGKEYRVWDAYRSKLAAAIQKGLRDVGLVLGSNVLYLGASTGTTVSHISDIVGTSGCIFAVEFSPRVAREFIDRVAVWRANIIPIVADARNPDYPSIFGKATLIYCDIAQPDQTEIAIKNCYRHLVSGGELFLAIKSRSIDVAEKPKRVFRQELEKLRKGGFTPIQTVTLEPFDQDHALVRALYEGT